MPAAAPRNPYTTSPYGGMAPMAGSPYRPPRTAQPAYTPDGLTQPTSMGASASALGVGLGMGGGGASSSGVAPNGGASSMGLSFAGGGGILGSGVGADNETGLGFGGQVTPRSASQDAGSRRLQNSSVNWSGFNSINSWLNAPGIAPGVRSQRANYLNAMDVMPTYNGVALDQVQPTRVDISGGGGYTGGAVTPEMVAAGGGGQMWGVPSGDTTIARDQPAPVPAHAPLSGAGVGSYGPLTGGPIRSLPLGGGAGAGGTGDPVADAYARLIANGGNALSASDRNAQEQQARDAANRATGDAIKQADLAAVRRGDSSLSSVGTNEAAIRQRGAALADTAGRDVRSGFSQQAMQALLSALSGASGYSLGAGRLGLDTEAQRAQMQILLAQLAAQQGAGAFGGMMSAGGGPLVGG